MTVLSTRMLTPSQRSALRLANINVVDYDAIAIALKDFELPNTSDNLIFTSKNGAKAYLEKLKATGKEQKTQAQAFCVGEKTSSYLEENGIKVLKMAQNASELANFIVKSNQKTSFLIFTGNRNRPELEKQLAENNIPFKALEVYETQLVPRKFEQEFQGILFFSPSGVQSFTRENKFPEVPVFCIGATTAREAQHYFQHIVIADKTTVDGVIESVITNLSTTINKA